MNEKQGPLLDFLSHLRIAKDKHSDANKRLLCAKNRAKENTDLLEASLRPPKKPEDGHPISIPPQARYAKLNLQRVQTPLQQSVGQQTADKAATHSRGVPETNHTPKRHQPQDFNEAAQECREGAPGHSPLTPEFHNLSLVEAGEFPSDELMGTPGSTGAPPSKGSRRKSKPELSQATRDILVKLNGGDGFWSDDSPLVKQMEKEMEAYQAAAKGSSRQPAIQQQAAPPTAGILRQAEEAGTSRGLPAVEPTAAQRAADRYISSEAEAQAIYRAFTKQQEALDFAAACNRNAAGDAAGPHEEIVRCWCEEVRGYGGAFYRTFLAASYEAFLSRYVKLPVFARHCYEVIQADKPCNLYFDLEFSKAANPGVNGESLVDSLLIVAAAHIKQLWDLEFSEEDVVELDSSTEEKFSRHLVVRIPGHALESNLVARSFVNRLLTQPESVQLIVQEPASNAATCIIDKAVYTRNRHFRVLGSSKGGKKATLQHTGRFIAASRPNRPFSTQFLDSLVCNVPTDPSLMLLSLDPVDLNTRGMTKAAGLSLPKKATSGLVQHSTDGIPVAMKTDDRDSGSVYHYNEVQRRAEAARGFLERVAADRSGAAATVRTIAHCGQGGIVAFSMSGSGAHFCENLGRNHKSNFIYFVIDFVTGLYCQKCYDPDCHNFRSAWLPIPEELRLPTSEEGHN